MECNCITAPKSGDPALHNDGCNVRKGIKFPRLFYWEETVDAWCPAPHDVASIIFVDDMSDGEVNAIRFKRIDMTDDEMDALPEE